MKEIIVRFGWPGLEAYFEIKPHFEETFDALIVIADYAGKSIWSPCKYLGSCVFLSFTFISIIFAM